MADRDVFISYKAEEIEEAIWVKSVLEGNGISCWMAPDCIPGGSNYAIEIPKAIRNAKFFVLILSSKAQSSQWVAREVDIAVNEGKTVLPFMLENCALKDDFNFYLTNVQRYAAYENKSAAAEKMLKEIKAVLGRGTHEQVEDSVKTVMGDDVATSVPTENRTGVNNRTINSAKTDTNASETGNKQPAKSKSKVGIISAIAIAAVAIIVLIIFMIIPKGGDAEAPKDDSISNAGTQAPDSDTTEDVKNIVMSDDLFDFTFELEGVLYQLPCKYEALTQNGWTISSTGYNSDTKLAGNSYDSFYMSKDGRKITVYSYNSGGNAKSIKECMTGGIECEAYNDVDFIIAKGITVKSSVEEIQTAFGVPGYSNSGSDYESMTYYAQKDSSYNSIKFYCTNDGKYSSISMKNFIETENDKTTTNTEKPDYLNEYKDPTDMGNDLKSAVVKIEGDLYQLPAPVSAFIDNGWKIAQQSGDVVAGGTDSIRVEKDDKKLDLYIVNYSEYQTTVENCAVYKVYVDNRGGTSVSIGSESKSITIGTEKADVDALVSDEFNYYEGTYNHSYSYSEYKERDFNLSINVDKETGKVSTISVSCKTWEY